MKVRDKKNIYKLNSGSNDLTKAEFNSGILLKSYTTIPVKDSWRLRKDEITDKLIYEKYYDPLAGIDYQWTEISSIGSLSTDSFIIFDGAGGVFFKVAKK